MKPDVKTPVISGMKKNYLLNDILKLNCSVSIKNAKLKWFIMDKEVSLALIKSQKGSFIFCIAGQ